MKPRARAPRDAAERRRRAGGRPRHDARPVTLGHYLSLGAILFALSVIGIFLNRKNLIVLLMAIELMLLAVNMNFVAFSHYLGDMARPGVRVLHPHRRRRRIGDRPGDPGRAVPQRVDTSTSTNSTRSRADDRQHERNSHRIYLLAVPLAPLVGADRRRPVRQADRPRAARTRVTILGVLISFVHLGHDARTASRSTARASTRRSTSG